MFLSTPIVVSLDELIELGREGDFGKDSHRPTEENVDEKILQDNLSSAVSHLPVQDRSLVNSVYFQGKKKSEYAKSHRISPAAVTKRLKRIHKHLRMELDSVPYTIASVQ